MKDCADTAQVALPSFRGRDEPVTWGAPVSDAPGIVSLIRSDPRTNGGCRHGEQCETPRVRFVTAPRHPRPGLGAGISSNVDGGVNRNRKARRLRDCVRTIDR